MLARATQEERTQIEKEHAEILRVLAQLGGNLVQEDALIYRGKQMILPETMEGDIDAAVDYLQDYKEQQETETEFSRTFRYRPWDGANAFQVALKKVFGSTGIGKPIVSFFGRTPPQFRTIETGPSTTTQVPWGRVQFPPLKAMFHLGAMPDPEVGMLFHLSATAPRKFRGHIEGLFIAIEEELKSGSIYKGKAIDGASNPGYMDPFRTDRTKVVYSDEVYTQLSANVWTLLEHTDTVRELGLPLKRTVLVEGPYGTGKSLAAQLTAQKAIENGWTFVFCRPGTDDLHATMQTAQLYAPSVVFFEDIDVIAETGDPDAVAKLLDMFDGIASKGTDLVCVLTTNHVERIHKAMLRPGRLDAVIHIGALDASGYERLIKAVVPEHLLAEDLDYELISKAYEGFLPSFAKEAIDRAMRYAIHRTGARPDVFTTQDFIDAAEGLRPQLELMENANEGVRKPTLSAALENTIKDAVDSIAIVDGGGDAMYQLDSASKDALGLK